MGYRRHGVDGRDRGAGGRFALYIVATIYER